MADFLIDPETIDYDSLPPLVAKGEDREEVIGALVEAWCTPMVGEVRGNESPGVTLNLVALVDANTGQPVDLGELLRRVEARLRELGEGEDYRFRQELRIVLRGCRVDACHSSKCTVRPRLMCHCTKFPVGASFRGAKLGDGVNFVSSTLGNYTTFERTRLGSSASFWGAMVGDSANFKWSRFGNNASFEGATLGDYSSFEGAALGDHASFWGVTIGDHATFEGVTLGDHAGFTGAVFGNRANLTKTTLGSHANFDEATFGNSTNFEGARLGDHASLKGTKLGDLASFRGARLGHGASFKRAKMGSGATFSEAQFGRCATFEGARVGNHASFAMARLGDHANFSVARIGVSANFTQAWLGDHVSFEGATLGPGACFQEAKLNDGASFEGVTLGYGATFESATLGDGASFGSATLGDGIVLSRTCLADSDFAFCDLRMARLRSARFGRRRPGRGWKRLGWMLLSLGSHWFSWRLVRGVGELSVLTRVSYIALLVVPLLAGAWPAVRALIEAWANKTHNAELLPANMPSQWALVFFAAAAVGLGHLVYQLGAPQLIKEKSREDVVRERMMRFREHYRQERTEILRSAVSKLADVARMLPFDRHPNLVKHHGETVWIPSNLDWFSDPEIPPSVEGVDEDGRPIGPPRPPVSALDREAIAVEEGARAEYDCAAHEDLGAAWWSFGLYLTGAFLLGWLFWDQAKAIAGQAGWGPIVTVLSFVPYVVFVLVPVSAVVCLLMVSFADAKLRPATWGESVPGRVWAWVRGRIRRLRGG